MNENSVNFEQILASNNEIRMQLAGVIQALNECDPNTCVLRLKLVINGYESSAVPLEYFPKALDLPMMLDTFKADAWKTYVELWENVVNISKIACEAFKNISHQNAKEIEATEIKRK